MQIRREDLVPCDQIPGYYVSSAYSSYSANENGDIWDRVHKRYVGVIKSPTSKNSGYRRVNDIPAHRIVADIFLSKEHIPANEICLVNHINGIKTDNRVVNLEWTTYQGNAIHAYRTGLRPDNKPVLCKHLETGEIIRYHSYWECARALKVNGSRVFTYLNRKRRNTAFLGEYALIRDGEEWEEIDRESMSYANLEIFASNTKTKHGYIFKSLSDTSRFTGIMSHLLYSKFADANIIKEKHVIIGDWVIMKLHHAADWIKQSKPEVIPASKPISREMVKRKPKRVSVKFLETQETTEYDSLEEFCVILKEKKNTVQKHILNNNGVWHGLFEIKYLS